MTALVRYACSARAVLHAAWALLASYALVGCTAPALHDELLRTDASRESVTESNTDAATPSPARCLPAIASESLPVRQGVLQGASTGSQEKGVYVTDLFAAFSTQCGGCHASPASLGGYSVSVDNFTDKITDLVQTRVRSEDPAFMMPPVSSAPGAPQRFSERAADDPVRALADLLASWQAAGKPAVFYPSAATSDTSAAGDASPYKVSREVGMAMTNIGSCVPDGRMLGTDAMATRGAKLDAQFAGMTDLTDLPKSLSETDFVSLDSEVLAQHGLYAYAPTYTLWADNAKKFRYVRVPQGTSIAFDAATQSFLIPENTRFYKTFMKRVVDIQGNARFRKVETRLIVTRADAEAVDGVDYVPASIFGSYKWNDDETEAMLVSDPYRDGSGFSDHLDEIVVDEQVEDKLLRMGVDDPTRMLAEGATRTYAIPGSDRCTHCHMGAPGRNFQLGFTPLQIRRRPLGEGGVIEPAEEHELDQLQRFIDYGLITGMTSPAQVVPLEDSQPGRAPRNVHELNAQGYMVGNCAHCHNPRGFPSKREKSLADVLNFEPGTKGGVFQFPLDKFSPRTFRGAGQDIKTPYITPSLFDHPIALAANRGFDAVSRQGLKWISDLSAQGQNEPVADHFSNLSPLSLPQGRPLLAPWRSLIYRNVDAPFSYEDGATIFPHMPMDTPGYDCRVRRLMGSWMTSIPARLLSGLPADIGEMSDSADQPYEEVAPTDPDYDLFSQQAAQRLARFQASERFDDCPLASLDVVAPEVASNQYIVPKAQLTVLNDADGQATENYWLFSPARPHYPNTDLHDDLIWRIRRDDWEQTLVETGVDSSKSEGDQQAASALAIATARSLRLRPALQTLLLTERPFGLWLQKPECSVALAKQPTVGSFSATQRPSWMDIVQPPTSAPVYMISPGAQVFSTVCSKCHGPDATGKSALASTIADLTGGRSRVANLRDGVFGPLGDAGHNADAKFAIADGKLGGTTQDWTARYIVWMGLGGTNAAIPKTVLSQIGSAKVLGAARHGSLGSIDAKTAANMLGIVKEACLRFLPGTQKVIFDVACGRMQQSRAQADSVLTKKFQFALEDHALIATNGDADLWELLCQTDNPAPVRGLRVDSDGLVPLLYASISSNPDTQHPNLKLYDHIYQRSAFPSDALVGDQNGQIVTGLHDDNVSPWCVDLDGAAIVGAKEAGAQEAGLSAVEMRLGHTLPRCPAALISTVATPNHRLSIEDGVAWATRGAANAGLAVYYYLSALAAGEVAPQVSFDKCEELE